MRKLWIGVATLVVIAAGSLLYLHSKPRGEPVLVRMKADASRPRVPLGEAGMDPAAIQQAADYAGSHGTTALVVGRGGHIVYEKYWDATTFDTPVDPGFAPALLALAVGTALEDRQIHSLDAPLSNYLPELKPPESAFTTRELLARDHELPLERSADLLALALERLTQLPYQTLVAQHVWQPLGGGDLEFMKIPGPFRPMGVSAACCIRARVGDWMRVAEALANDGIFEGNQLTPPRYVVMMLKPAHRDATRGFFTRVDGNFAAHDTAWLEGTDGQRLWVVPSLRLTILRLGRKPSVDWDEAMIPNTIVRGTSGWKPPVPGEGVDPKLYAPH